jgi:ribosomal protein S12 methylthiotransferase
LTHPSQSNRRANASKGCDLHKIAGLELFAANIRQPQRLNLHDATAVAHALGTMRQRQTPQRRKMPIFWGVSALKWPTNEDNQPLSPDPAIMNTASAPKISFVSLGCPKALVDSERIITRLRAEGYELARKHHGADLVIVNTCGFLDSAKSESLAAIGEAMAENGKVIVTGCMGAEPEQIEQAHPGVLSITGPQQYQSVMDAVHRAAPPQHNPLLDLLPPQGIKLTPRHYAYLKVSEGCNNRCTFCIIPKLRGDLVSRPIGEVLREAEKLVAAGVKELLVVSQDTSAYGVDLKYAPSTWKDREVRTRFFDMAKELGELGAWVRLQYVYPYPHVDEVISLMSSGKVLPYLDIPFQHGNAEVLKRMKRPAAQDKTLARIANWRAQCPELTLRSTFIVGFPGESDAEFNDLLDWLDEAQIDRVGCFKYEPVAGATSNALEDPVPEEIKTERWNRLMERQQAISARRLKKKVGSRQKVIIDETGPTVAKGRTQGDAPEIDGAVYVSSRRPLRQGEIVTVKIERSDAYDLHGTAAGF